MGTFRINIEEKEGTDLTLRYDGIAGENLVAGDLCYLNTDGKYWKSNASLYSKCSTELRISENDLSADEEGKFISKGQIITSGLTVGVRYYVSNLSGQITTNELSSPNLVRYIGTASSETQLEFNPMDLSYNKSLQEQIDAIETDKTFYYSQVSPSNNWIINHNLDKRPSVTVIDSGGSQVIGDVDYTNINTVTITFSAAFSGYATLN